MTDLTERLRECPFCGGEAKPVSGTSSTVQCQNDQCIIGDAAPFNDFSHRQDAIAAWNKRPTLENLTQENARLREALEECAEELGNEIRARYSGMVDHPAMKLRYDRDMASVYATRKALGGGDE